MPWSLLLILLVPRLRRLFSQYPFLTHALTGVAIDYLALRAGKGSPKNFCGTGRTS